ncbi:DUF5980 family protein [Micromonospora craniellae]|uniref:DUF5980 family protein n=1 Tax=Micromonospora craniellae TaxID=2294034 RepID=UPI0011C1ADA4|nr:DUF5980 family protein [Micromonospora craniellae]
MLAALPLLLIISVTRPAVAAPSSTWTLLDGSAQYVCRTSGNHPPGGFGYYLATVIGEWSRPIDLALTNLPGASTSVDGRIYPGSNHPRDDGSTVVNGLVGYYVLSAPIGIHHPWIVATDGTQSQSFQVTLEIKQRC